MQHRSLVLPNIGIDVGHFATKFTSGRTSGPANLGSAIRTDSFPSVAVTTGPLKELATARRLDGVTLSGGDNLFFVGKSAPDLLGPHGILRRASEFYSTTDAYKALQKCALWYIAKQHGVTRSLVIEHLVVGLPLNTISTHLTLLQSNSVGTHELPAPHDASQTITVEVKAVVVVAQPQGAIVNYIESQPNGVVEDEDLLLVIDMGGGTFDWFVSTGDYSARYNICGAVSVGTLNCAQTIAGLINPLFASNQTILDRIDKALRNGADEFRLGTVTYSIADYWQPVEGHITASFEEMRRQIGNFAQFNHVILTGGGAPLLQKTLRRTNPELSSIIKMDTDPVYGNVKGFHQMSEEVTR